MVIVLSDEHSQLNYENMGCAVDPSYTLPEEVLRNVSTDYWFTGDWDVHPGICSGNGQCILSRCVCFDGYIGTSELINFQNFDCQISKAGLQVLWLFGVALWCVGFVDWFVVVRFGISKVKVEPAETRSKTLLKMLSKQALKTGSGFRMLGIILCMGLYGIYRAVNVEDSALGIDIVSSIWYGSIIVVTYSVQATQLTQRNSELMMTLKHSKRGIGPWLKWSNLVLNAWYCITCLLVYTISPFIDEGQRPGSYVPVVLVYCRAIASFTYFGFRTVHSRFMMKHYRKLIESQSAAFNTRKSEDFLRLLHRFKQLEQGFVVGYTVAAILLAFTLFRTFWPYSSIIYAILFIFTGMPVARAGIHNIRSGAHSLRESKTVQNDIGSVRRSSQKSTNYGIQQSSAVFDAESQVAESVVPVQNYASVYE